MSTDATVLGLGRPGFALHDIVGHGLSVTVLQLVAALGIAEKGEPGALRERLLGTERSARQTLAEMRRLLGLLDEGEPSDAPVGLGRLERLIADTRAAGAQIELAISGERRELPAGIDLTAFRILQESLTNVLKHARPPRARVTVDYATDTLTVEVRDEGQAHANGSPAGGRGLTGIRERVALYDGQLELGPQPQPQGGYLVRVRLPLAE